MPIYEYKCPKCGILSKRRAVDDRNKPVTCKCGEKAEYSPSFKTQPPVFKGTGFYATDYCAKKRE